MEYSCLIMAAGSGQRMGLGFNKVLYKLASGKTILEESMKHFIDDDDCKEIIVVINEKIDFIKHSKVIFEKGGTLRMDSVLNGLKKASCDFVMIHDGSRPYFKKRHLEQLKASLIKNNACILAVKAKDTIKKVVDLKIKETLDRDFIYLAQTPQCFKKDLLLKAYENCDFKATDDSSIVEFLGHEVSIVEGDYANIKITFLDDLVK